MQILYMYLSSSVSEAGQVLFHLYFSVFINQPHMVAENRDHCTFIVISTGFFVPCQIQIRHSKGAKLPTAMLKGSVCWLEDLA